MENDTSVNASSQKWTACHAMFSPENICVACTIDSRSVEFFHFCVVGFFQSCKR